MGVVKRQSIKTTLIQYAMLPLGFLASIFVYPYNSNTNDGFGFYNYILSVASLLFPLIFLGVPNLAIKFFPQFKNESNGHNGFFLFLTKIVFIVLLFSVTLLTIFQGDIFELSHSTEPYITENRFILIPVAIILGLITYVNYYISNFNRIVVPNLIESLRNRIGVPAIIIAFGLGYFTLPEYAWIILLLFCLHLILLLFYLWKLGEFTFTPINKGIVEEHKREMFSFSMFATIGTLGGTLCNQIDSIMITELIDVRSNGIYSIGRNISNVVSIPSKAVFTIMAPIIAKLIAENKMSEVDKNYKKTSHVLLTSGLFILLALTVVIQDLVHLMNRNDINYSELIPVVTLLGISILFDLITSINSHIIIYSKYYRFNVILIILLGVLNIILNYVFIKKLDMGLVGAAYASAISIIIYNLVKFLFVFIKFKMQPLERKSVWIVLLGASIYFMFIWIDLPFSPIINICLKEGILLVLFLGPILFFRLSEETSNLVNVIIEKARKILHI